MHYLGRLRPFIAAFVLLCALGARQMAVAAPLPAEIRVGLSFGKEAWATAGFTSSTGLALGAERGDSPLWTGGVDQRVTLTGDGFRLEIGAFNSLTDAQLALGRLKSVQIDGVIFRMPDGSWSVQTGQSPSQEGLAALRATLSNKGYSKLREVGGYRLELKEDYHSRTEVDKRISSLRSSGIRAYPAYQNGWRVWVGDSTEAELDEWRAVIGKVLPGMQTTLVNPDIERVIVLDRTGEIVMVYSSRSPVIVADGPTSQRADNYRVEVGPYANLLAANQAQQQLMTLGTSVYRIRIAEGQSFSYKLWVGDGWELGSAQELEKAIKAKGMNTRLVGPNRLVSFASYPSRESAQSKALQLRQKGFDTTVLYDSGWRIAVGHEATTDERDRLHRALTTAAPLEPYAVSEIDGGRMQVFDGSGNLLALLQIPHERQGALRLWPLGSGAVFSEEKKDRYPGFFEFRRYYHGGMTVINCVGVEDYVAGVAAKEMYPSWPLEALKAQAVASRSYVTTRVGGVAFSQWGCDVDDTTRTQVYTGLERAGLPNIQKAVKETTGQYAWYNGQIATTYFHADGGGHTENVENVWSSPVPYIRGVAELFPSEGPNATWQESRTGEEIRQALIRNGFKDIGEVTDIIIKRTGVSGAPVETVVVGTAGEEILQKDKSRTVFDFASNNFTIAKPGTATAYFTRGVSEASVTLNTSQASVIGAGGKQLLSMVTQPTIKGSETMTSMTTKVSDKFVFNGRGHGHGLGMSQWGAKAMADHGYTYIQILQHYYQGIVVK